MVAALAACGGGSGNPATGGGASAPPSPSEDDSGDDSGKGSGDDSGSGSGNGSDGNAKQGGTSGPGSGEELGPASGIPQGGGKVFKDRKVVVTQPESGQFKAFSAICRHQGCVVGDVSGGTINCPCHGSKYAIADGSVRHGPATQGLPSARVHVRNGMLWLG
ncbi:Rieske (2Fe-2S) protein [Streptomyces sp. NPDC003077]|uniref:Rieske (2Fe-2S) protein n=1 Tax=Streptomyces sp. NPDC003077 TaxID=3154443 RepID=UPI0033AF0761